MSTNNTINTTPGLVRIQPKIEPGLAVKVTGRNLAGVSYIAALEAERRGVTMEVAGVFGPTGELEHIRLTDDTLPEADDYREQVELVPGDVLVLPPLEVGTESYYMDEDTYRLNFREV